MTKTHKDIAVFMVQLSENESLSEQQVVREIADKTRELLNQLRSVLRCCNTITDVAFPFILHQWHWFALCLSPCPPLSILLAIFSHVAYPATQKI
jgi:hypothetical protein